MIFTANKNIFQFSKILIRQKGGMNIVFALFMAVVLSVASTYIIKRIHLKNKLSANLSIKSSDQNILRNFLTKKLNKFKAATKTEKLTFFETCTDNFPSYQNDDSGNIDIYFTCQKIDDSILNNNNIFVGGTIIKAWTVRTKAATEKIFIPNFFSIGHVYEIGENLAGTTDNKRTNKHNIAQNSTILKKGTHIYEGDTISSGEKNFIKIRLSDDTFIRLGGGAKVSKITITTANYSNNINDRQLILTLDQGIIKFKSSHKETNSTVNIKMRSLLMAPIGDEGNEYIVTRFSSDILKNIEEQITAVTVLTGKVKIASIGNNNTTTEIVIAKDGHEVFIKEMITALNNGDIQVTYKYEDGKLLEEEQTLPNGIKTSWWD